VWRCGFIVAPDVRESDVQQRTLCLARPPHLSRLRANRASTVDVPTYLFPFRGAAAQAGLRRSVVVFQAREDLLHTCSSSTDPSDIGIAGQATRLRSVYSLVPDADGGMEFEALDGGEFQTSMESADE
jgi:hypothetical protein